MQTIIVPTDFSATSFNAAQYAVQMAASQKEATIVLFHVYDKLVAGSDGTPLLVDPEDRRQARIMALNNTRDRLGAPANIKIECIAEEGVLVEQLNRLTNRLLADIIVMGMNGSSPLERIMIGSNTLNTVHAVNAPVLIIPPSAIWSGVKNIAFASDFKDVESSTPIGMLKKMLDFFKPNLFVVNVDSEHHVELTEEYKSQRAKMDNMLQGYSPDYRFIRLFDFTEAINQFILDEKIDVVIIVPRKHSFLKSLFRSSNTNQLAYHSFVPVLCISEP